MNDRSLVTVMTNGIGAHLTSDEKRAHLINAITLSNKYAFRRFCRLIKSKQCCHNRGISATKPQISHDCRKLNEFRTQISVDFTTSGTLPRIRSSFKIAVAIDGVTHEKRHRGS